MESFVFTHIRDKNYFIEVKLANERCVRMLEAILRAIKRDKTADCIKKNKQKIKEFFTKLNWSIDEMTG